MPRPISIVIPHYQKQKHLQLVVDELRLQISPDDEIIVSDDNSPDGVQDFGCPCTRVITLPKQSPHIYRLCTVRNYGIENARNDQIIILDPDCIPNPRFLDYARAMYDPNVLFGGCIDKVQEDGSIKYDSRRNSNRSYWCDTRDKGGSGIWGGCMMFSKSRTKPLGWFDEAYNNGWGAEEHAFADKCYHSGMRLRFSMELQVTHQWHPKDTKGNDRNIELWKTQREMHREHLNTFTDYKPAVGVMVITMLRPELINQCLQAIFRDTTPVKVRLINNGDNGEDTRRICEEWGNRWAVDYIHHPRKWPAEVRNDSLKWAKANGFKMLVFVDDDVTVINNGLTRLIYELKSHPEYVAMSGKLQMPEHRTRLLGGPVIDGVFCNLSNRNGTFQSDWVGGGFTAHRTEPLLLYDEEYQTGFNDYDWSVGVRQQGYKLGVTGNATAWHAAQFTREGIQRYKSPSEYNTIRYDRERHDRMKQRFYDKWGFMIKGGSKIID